MINIEFNQIIAQALKVITVDELKALQVQPRATFFGMVHRRLMQPGRAPIVEELEGIRELVTEVMWHPAIGRVPK
jgi:hypothetical protein